MKFSLFNSFTLVSFLLAYSPSVRAAEILVDREYYSGTGDHLYTVFHNEGYPAYQTEAYNYFGLDSVQEGQFQYALNRYYTDYFGHGQHEYSGDIPPYISSAYVISAPGSGGGHFEGTLGYYYPWQLDNSTCTYDSSIPAKICSVPTCYQYSCPAPPGLVTLYQLLTFTQGRTAIDHNILTTSIDERNALLSTGSWYCDFSTASGYADYRSFPFSPFECVLGFVYPDPPYVPSDTASVPEPSSILGILLFGLLGFRYTATQHKVKR